MIRLNFFFLFIFTSLSSFVFGQTSPLDDQLRSLELTTTNQDDFPQGYATYDMIEVGFKLPREIERSIDQFIERSGSPKKLNPFEPRDIDIQFFFEPVTTETTRLAPGSNLDQRRFGFYYEPFIIDTTDRDVNNWKHLSRYTDYKFRARYTPKQPGKYKVYSKLRIRSTEALVTDTIIIEVKQGKNHGFIEVGDSKRYLTLDDETFFPSGQNLPWPSCHTEFDSSCNDLECAGRECYCYGRTMGPKGFLVYHKEMEALSKSGANWCRVLVAPWNLEIEFEDLNDYSKRMHCAWEMDNIIKKAEDLDMFLHFNLHVHYALEDPSVYSFWQWDYGDLECFPYDDPYCYYDELGLKTPLAFLKSKEAQYHYKNRLRYMIARWGYSTNIGLMELLSEANNAGHGSEVGDECLIVGSGKEMYAKGQNPKAVYDWQNEMCKFIKTDLNHFNHPLAVSYTGIPAYTRGDSSFYSPYVDVATWNEYSLSLDKYFRLSDIIHQFQDKRQRGPIRDVDPPFLDKPILFSEIGPGYEYIEFCDDDLRWIKAVWMSSFIGIAGTGLNWSNQFHPDLWTHLGRIDDFMKPVGLDAGNWESYSIERGDKLAEVVYLKPQTGKKKVVGYLHNRTNNFYTQRTADDSPCDAFNKEGRLTSPYQNAQDVEPSRGGNKLDIRNMGAFASYYIEWVDPYTGNVVEKQKVNCNIAGKLKLQHPTLSKDGSSFLVFRIFKVSDESI